MADAWSREREVWDVNALGTLNVVLAVAEHAPEVRLLVVSSSEVYGRMDEKDGPVAEDRPLNPISPYARSKVAAELAGARDDVDIVIARPFPHTGPGQAETFAIPSFAAQIARIEAGQRRPRSTSATSLLAATTPTSAAWWTPTFVCSSGAASHVSSTWRRGGVRSMRSMLDRLLALAPARSRSR